LQVDFLVVVLPTSTVRTRVVFCDEPKSQLMRHTEDYNSTSYSYTEHYLY